MSTTVPSSSSNIDAEPWHGSSQTSLNQKGNRPTSHQSPTRPGTETLGHLRQIGSSIGSFALKPLRDLALAEKLNAINIELEEKQQQKDIAKFRKHLEDQDREKREKEYASEMLARQLQDEEDQNECRRIKEAADEEFQRVGRNYDSLVKFIGTNPSGTYDEFIEFLLVGGDRNYGEENYYNTLLFENFYEENSTWRKLWNDNLTLGLSDQASTLEGRKFAPALPIYDNNISGEYQIGLQGSPSSTRERTHSEDERLRNLGQIIRERTSNIDRQKLKQQLGSAVSMVSSIALKPLRDLQMAEKLNAMNIDMEDAETQRKIDQHMRNVEERKEMEEMMKIKKEAEESCLLATREHLLDFLKEHPHASYNEWIEDLHPENAHEGTLLEGLSKTIDHRFYVEESDHRKLWNDNLRTYLDMNSEGGRSFVPARAKQMKDNGDYVDAQDLLSDGNFTGVVKTDECDSHGLDLINFD